VAAPGVAVSDADGRPGRGAAGASGRGRGGRGSADSIFAGESNMAAPGAAVGDADGRAGRGGDRGRHGVGRRPWRRRGGRGGRGCGRPHTFGPGIGGPTGDVYRNCSPNRAALKFGFGGLVCFGAGDVLTRLICAAPSTHRGRNMNTHN
jgi:hypothetical protein